MADTRPFGWADVLWLLLVLSVAGGLRGGYLWRYADMGRQIGPYRVQEVPDAREGVDKVTTHISPGLPTLLEWLARAVGRDDKVLLRSWVLWLQCGLGTATAGLYFLFARRAFASRIVAVLAGLAVAAHPFWILATAEVQDGVLTSFVLAVVLLLGARAGQTAGPFASLLFGVALAGLSLVRAACLPFAFVALTWFLLRCRSLPRGWLCAILAFLGFGNGLAPWTILTIQTLGEPVPVVDSSYLHLWIGNNPHATGGPMSQAALQTAPPGSLDASAEAAAQRPYDRLAHAVLDQLRTNPVGSLRRRLYAAAYFLVGEQFFTQHRLAEPTGSGEPLPGVEEALTGTLVGVFALAFLGWRWSYAWRRTSQPAALAVMWLPLPYLLGHAEALHGPRLPLDGLLLCYAAFALTCLMPFLGRSLREGPSAGPEGASARAPRSLPTLPTSRGPSWR
jgi:hypothetical protein